MRWAILVLGIAEAACTSDTTGPPGRTDIGCGGGTDAGCTEDFSITGICTQDLPHMCFCGANGNASAPNSGCAPTVVKPPKPNTKAYCCP